MTRYFVTAVAFITILVEPVRAQSTTLVDAGGHRLEMVVRTGPSPTVVFDGGAGGGMGAWASIRDSIGLEAGTVLFERAGFGGSEVGPSPRTAHRFAAELRTALENARVEFPVVLVGYSLGGILSIAFADLYPTDLAGLVFVDPATDRSYQRMFEEKPEWLAELVAEVTGSVENLPGGWRGQMESLPESIAELREFGPLVGVPTVVLTAMTARGEWPKETNQDMQEWLTDHRTLVGQIPGSRHVVLEEATHGRILSEPEVIREILQVVRAARPLSRSNKRLLLSVTGWP